MSRGVIANHGTCRARLLWVMWLRLRAVHCSPPAVAASVAAGAPLHGWSRCTRNRRGPSTESFSLRAGVACACGFSAGASSSPSTGRFSLRVTVPCACCSRRGASGKRSPAGGAHCDVIPQHRAWHRIVALGRGFERLVGRGPCPRLRGWGPTRRSSGRAGSAFLLRQCLCGAPLNLIVSRHDAKVLPFSP